MAAVTPAFVVSRASGLDSRAGEHPVAGLARAGMLQAGRPTVVSVSVGVGAVLLRAPATATARSGVPAETGVTL